MEDKILQVLRDKGRAMDHHEIYNAIQTDEATILPVLEKMAKDKVLDLVPFESPNFPVYKIR